jgi:uncharacterized protein YvpB
MKFFFPCILVVLFLGSEAAAQERNGVWLEVPYVKQSENGCGSASISMVLQYWNAHGAATEDARTDVNAIQQKLYSPKEHGILASEVERYLKESGFRTFSIPGKWEDLREQLTKGRPVIVGLQPQSNKSPLHFVVVTGVDWERPAIFVNDPARGKLLRIERADFEKAWRPVGNWMLLVVPQQAN